jgi:hypothetical protein
MRSGLNSIVYNVPFLYNVNRFSGEALNQILPDSRQSYTVKKPEGVLTINLNEPAL